MNSNEKHRTRWLWFLWNNLQVFHNRSFHTDEELPKWTFSACFFSPFILIDESFPKATLTKSFSTRKEERSTKTHVGIMKNTAWHPRMFSNRRWCIRESRNTWWRTHYSCAPTTPCSPCNNNNFLQPTVTAWKWMVWISNEDNQRKQISLWKSGFLTGNSPRINNVHIKMSHKPELILEYTQDTPSNFVSLFLRFQGVPSAHTDSFSMKKWYDTARYIMNWYSEALSAANRNNQKFQWITEQQNCYLLWEDILKWKTQSSSKCTDESPHVKGQFSDRGQQDTGYYGNKR